LKFFSFAFEIIVSASGKQHFPAYFTFDTVIIQDIDCLQEFRLSARASLLGQVLWESFPVHTSCQGIASGGFL
jgi:hypothetical protein